MNSKIDLFKPEADYPEEGLVLMLDLEGFSKFFNQPDVHFYVPIYLNHILQSINICIHGGTPYWFSSKKTYTPLPNPIHWKFLGDGVLVIWKRKDFGDNTITNLLNRFWILKNSFSEVNDQISENIPVTEVPKKIRVSIASGTIYRMQYKAGTEEEFIGFPINLASRLLNYCREVGFIASARIRVPKKSLETHQWFKVIAKAVKGFSEEVVLIDQDDYNELTEERKTELFAKI